MIRSFAALSLVHGLTAATCLQSMPSALGTGALRNAVPGAQKYDACMKKVQVPVGLDEETALGGTLAVNLVGNGGGLVIDLPQGDPKTTPPPPSPKNRLERYVDVVGRNLGEQSERPTLAWTFGVLQSDGVSAVSTPGGYVLVTRGLFGAVDNEAQLAGVLAHEIGHVAKKHALRTYQSVKEGLCKKAFAGAMLGGGVSGAASNIPYLDALTRFVDDASGGALNLNDPLNGKLLGQLTDDLVDGIVSHGYAQDDELEADRFAAELLVSAGYRPQEYIAFLGKVPNGSGLFKNHPPAKDRQAALEKWLADFAQSGSLLAADAPFAHYKKPPLPPQAKRL